MDIYDGADNARATACFGICQGRDPVIIKAQQFLGYCNILLHSVAISTFSKSLL